MTRIATARPGVLQGVGATLPGLRNLLRKDTAEWLRSSRPWVVMIVSTVILLLTAANGRIVEWAARIAPEPGAAAELPSLVPIDNLLMAVGTQTIVFAVIGATMGLLIVERERGTLAWTASKPVSRTSILVSKWITSTSMLWLTAVVVPLVATSALVTVLYGAPDDGPCSSSARGWPRCPRCSSRSRLPRAPWSRAPPPSRRSGWRRSSRRRCSADSCRRSCRSSRRRSFSWVVVTATGGPLSLVTPIAWVLGVALLLLLGWYRLGRMEL